MDKELHIIASCRLEGKEGKLATPMIELSVLYHNRSTMEATKTMVKSVFNTIVQASRTFRKSRKFIRKE